MAEEQINEERTTEEAWSEVGRQFEALGESLATAFRAAWQIEDTRQHVQSVQNGLEIMVNRVGQAIQDASQSPEGERVRTEAAKTAESLRSAGEEAWEEAQPHLLSALTRINAELNKLLDRMEGQGTPEQEQAADDEASR
jgi:vacuolar-type H+-ATPase subunit I/STV1